MKHLLFLLTFFCSTHVLGATFEQASSQYQKQHYEQALEQFKTLSLLGNKDAQYTIGLMYLDGKGVEQDHLKAYAWFMLASSKGNTAALDMVKQYETALSEKHQSKSRSILQALEENHGDKVTYDRRKPKFDKQKLGQYRNYVPLRKDSGEYPKNALRKGLSGSIAISYSVDEYGRTRFHTVQSYTDEVFIRSAIKASHRFLYQPSSIDKQPVRIYSAKNLFTYITSSDVDYSDQVFSHLTEQQAKAANGTSIARYQYASSLQAMGNFLKESQRDQLGSYNRWYHMSAVDGLSHAQLMLGKNMLYGEQCESDSDTSHFWLSLSAEQGLPEAQFLLGIERYHGIRFDKDIEAGIALLTQSADQGHDHARIALAAVLLREHPHNEVQIQTARRYFTQVDKKAYYDKLSYLEVEAALYAAEKNYKKAIRSQESLIKFANKNDLPATDFIENLDKFKNQIPVTLSI